MYGLGEKIPGCHLVPHFEHKKMFSHQKSKLCHFMADLSENFRRCSSDSMDCHLLGVKNDMTV